MAQLESAKRALVEVTRRIHSGETSVEPGDEGLRPLIDVVDDIGRALASHEAGEVRHLIPFIAAGREALEDHYLTDGVQPNPMLALTELKEGAPYAAGVLWTLSALSHAWLSELDERQARVAERSGRTRTREAILELLEEHGLLRPQDALAALREGGQEIDPAIVSRALSDLMTNGLVQPAPAPPDSDRRHRWYQLTATPKGPPQVAVRALRDAVSWLYTVCDRREARRTVERVLDEAA